VGLPARLFWSGPNPRDVRWDLADPTRRRDLYEIVLVEGTLEDVRELINGAELVRLWDQRYLPRWVRSAWRPLIDSAGTNTRPEQRTVGAVPGPPHTGRRWCKEPDS
jgi:hypothetical protein